MSNVTPEIKKPKKKEVNYFDVREEDAVRAFLKEEDYDKKAAIYKKSLEKPIRKMTESIIRRYKLWLRNSTELELVSECIGFLNTKMYLFKPSKEKKAYSYFGTIIKRHAMNLKKKEDIEINRCDYTDTYNLFSDNENLSYRIDEEPTELDVNSFFFQIKDIVEECLNGVNKLKPNEEKVGWAIVEIMTNYTKFFDEKSKKQDKKQILDVLRNITALDTKTIRKSIEVFRTMYRNNKEEFLKNQENQYLLESDYFNHEEEF